MEMDRLDETGEFDACAIHGDCHDGISVVELCCVRRRDDALRHRNHDAVRDVPVVAEQSIKAFGLGDLFCVPEDELQEPAGSEASDPDEDNDVFRQDGDGARDGDDEHRDEQINEERHGRLLWRRKVAKERVKSSESDDLLL